VPHAVASIMARSKGSGQSIGNITDFTDGLDLIPSGIRWLAFTERSEGTGRCSDRLSGVGCHGEFQTPPQL
jgi:hypothetical protein